MGNEKLEPQCDAGCMVFTGGDRRHTKTCPHYPESINKMLDDAREDIATLRNELKMGHGAAIELAALRSLVESLEEAAKKAEKENLLFYPEALGCKHEGLEPDTCMTYMRCEFCGMPAHLANLLNLLKSMGAKAGE